MSKEKESELALKAPPTGIPGELLDVEVSVSPRGEINARQVVVELIGRETTYSYHGGGKGGGS